MKRRLILSGFLPAEEERLSELLELAGYACSRDDGGSPADGGPDGPALALIALRGGDTALIERELYRFRECAVGILSDPDNPRLLTAAAEHRPDALGLLPPEPEEVLRIARRLERGLMSAAVDRRLCRGLIALEHRYQWRADEIRVARVARHLAEQFRFTGYCRGRDETETLQLAIEEALTNALEHGCLGLDSALKIGSADGILHYEELKERRLAEPLFAGRRIRVDLSLLAGCGVLSVEDEGEGFDTSLAGQMIEAVRCGDGTGREHGKGIYLISSAFDRIVYSDGGRKLRLVKYKPRDEEEQK